MAEENRVRSYEETVKSLVQDGFGSSAEAYVNSPDHRLGADLCTLVRDLAPTEDDLALDVATGGGHVANALAPYVRQVVALDLTKEMLAAASMYAHSLQIDNILYVLGDAERLPFADASFSVVTCRIAAHHFPNPRAFIHEVYRVLKPGGRFAFTDNVSPEDALAAAFINEVERTRDVSHVWCPSISQWQAWLSEAGFVLHTERQWPKTYHFREWVARTAKTEEQVRCVEQLLSTANDDLVQRFSIVRHEHEIESMRVTQWFALCGKPPVKYRQDRFAHRVVGIHHVQVAAPDGCEVAARGFYGDILGLPEIAKPSALLARGGVWFACGKQQLHVGVEDGFVPARKAHPAFAVDGFDDLLERLKSAGIRADCDDSLDVRRMFVRDPFGNRIELIEEIAR